MNAVVADNTKVVRERRFYVDRSDECVFRALAQLVREGVTGTLHIDFNQGGVGSIRFQEEQRITLDAK